MCQGRLWLLFGYLVLLVWLPGVRSGQDVAPTCPDPPCDGPPDLPKPIVRVGLRVIDKGPSVTESRKGMAVMTMQPGNKTVSWTKTNTTPAEDTPAEDTPAKNTRALPLPIVTVSSRLLYEDEGERRGRDRGRDRGQERGRERGRDRERGRSSLSNDPQPRDLEFDPVPDGDPYRTDPTHAQVTLLSWAGSFVSLLQPLHFPLELVRSALEQRISGEELIRESLRVEPGFVTCMGVGVGLAVMVPLVGLFMCCCRLCGRCGGSKTQHHHTSCFNLQRRTLTGFLATFSCLVLLGISVVVLSNERLGAAVGSAQRSIHNNVRDLDTFLANTKMQLRFLVTNSFEQTADAIHNDLDDIEYLLGRPLQRELAAEAQIEVALDSLLHISSGLRNIASRMRALEASRLQAAARAEELRGRLLELSGDIQRFVARCPTEDAELCTSIDHRGLKLASRFDSFSFSEQLRLISEVERQNLTQTARHARLEFENIPSYVEMVTRNTREEVKRAVTDFRGQLYTRVRGLDDVAFDLEVRTRDLTWRLDRAAAALNDYEPYRWYTGLGIWVSLALVWILLTVGVCCGCCSNSAHRPPTERSCVSHSAGQTLIASVFFMILVSGLLWVVVVGVFVIGAHAHTFICHPLYEDPTYPTLTHLMDHSGMVYEEGPVLSNLLHPGRDVHLGMGHVLSLCKDGRTAYEVFQLRHYFDLEAETDHRAKLDLRGTLGHLKVNLSQVELLSPEAEAHLNDFLASIKIDLAPYRREMEKPLVETSLPALVEQMQNVAGQMRSVSASAELFKMVARTRSLISNTLYPLEKRKEDVTYQVATLDMEAMPLQRQINQSAGHLRTIQYFIHNHGSSLAAAKARGYVERLLGYTRQYTAHVRDSAFQNVAPCTPVWNLFDAGRGVVCNGIIEPLNALWLATSWCLLLFLPGICMGLALARFYLRMDNDDDTLPLHSNGSNTSLQQASTWTTKPSGGRSRSHPSHQHNGKRPPKQKEMSEVVAVAQLTAWRDAWKSGANFVTLELVARHVQRPVDWVKEHWNDATPVSPYTYPPTKEQRQRKRSASPRYELPSEAWKDDSRCCPSPDGSDDSCCSCCS